MTTTNKMINVHYNRLVSLGFSIQSHKYIQRDALAAIKVLEQSQDKEEAIQYASKMLYDILNHSGDAISHDIEMDKK